MSDGAAPHAGCPAPEGGARALFERQIVMPLPSRETLLALAGLLALALFLYRDAVFGGQVIFRRDVSMVWLPQVEAFVRGVSAGGWPLWDPFSGFGRPLLADPRAEVLYPPTWLNFILPPRVYYTLFVVAHMLFSGWGAFALARRWRTSRAGSFVAAALWCASGPFFSLTLMWHHLAAAAWIPWMFLALDRALDSGRARDALVAGLTLAAQIVAGSPDLTALGLPALGLYVLVRRPLWRAQAGARPTPAWRTALLALVFGLALAAPQWLPTLEWAHRSARSLQPYETATTWSLHPLALLEAALPLRFDRPPLTPDVRARLIGAREPWLHSIHLGLAAAALALSGLLARGRPRRGFLLVLLVASVLFSLGAHAPVHAALVKLLPPLGMLRFPVKAMVFAGLAWSLLAGFGFDAWRDAAGRRARQLCAAACLALAAGAMWATTRGAEALGAGRLELGPHASYRDLLAPLTALVALEAAASGLLLLLALRRRPGRARFGSALVALAALAPLTAAHADMGWTAPADLWTRRPALLDFIGRAPLTRVYVYDYSLLTPDQARADPEAARSYTIARAPYGWGLLETLVLGVHLYLNPPTAARWGLFGSYDRDILDFDPEPLARLNALLRASETTPTHLRLLRLGGVEFAAGLTPGAWTRGLVPLATVEEVFEQPIRLFRVPDTLPRTYVAGGVRVADGAAARALLERDDFDPAREIVLPAGAARAAPEHTPGTSRIAAWRADRVVVEARLTAPGHLVLLDAYDPGWRVRVDGCSAELLRANLAFRAVALAPGRHVVEFAYRPGSIAAGFALAALALVLAAAGALRARKRR
jgi:hypothetical protein